MKLINADVENERLLDFITQNCDSIQYAIEYKDGEMLSDIFFFYFDSQHTAFDLESVIHQLNENKEDVIKAIEENSKSEFEMIKINDLKELFEEYTQEQIDIIKSVIKENGGVK